MSELISGKEALIALANGENVEVRTQLVGNWVDLKDIPEYRIIDILENNHCDQFRLKPRTITINGIEVPACGAGYKPHTFMFVLNSLDPCEYSKIILDESDEVPPYWWSTEEEIKQVVAALRSIFK